MIYHYFMSIIGSVFFMLFAWAIAHQSFSEGQSEAFAYGFLSGGLVLGWILGAFDQDHGKSIAAGMATVIVGTGIYSRFKSQKHG